MLRTYPIRPEGEHVSGLTKHAEREICLSGMAGEAWVPGGIPHRVLELVRAFSASEHSGGSAMITIAALHSMGWKRARRLLTNGTGPVAEVANVFCKQEYKNDKDAEFTFNVFLHLVRFRPLGAGGNTNNNTFKPEVGEFAHDVGDYESKPPGVVYQSLRNPSVFSRDGGKTWYDLDDKNWAYPSDRNPARSR